VRSSSFVDDDELVELLRDPLRGLTGSYTRTDSPSPWCVSLSPPALPPPSTRTSLPGSAPPRSPPRRITTAGSSTRPSAYLTTGTTSIGTGVGTTCAGVAVCPAASAPVISQVDSPESLLRELGFVSRLGRLASNLHTLLNVLRLISVVRSTEDGDRRILLDLLIPCRIRAGRAVKFSLDSKLG
jgi:hypothetical protein